MPRPSRIALIAVAGLLGLVVVAAAVLLLVDANVYRARLEAAVSDALGMQVSIGGRVAIGFFPRLLITLEDVHIRNRGDEIASAKEARVGIDLLPLLRKEVRIQSIALKHARIAIERKHDGQFNVETPDKAAASFPAVDWPSVSLSEATLVYLDKRRGGGFEATDCRVDMHHLRLPGDQPAKLIKGVSFTAEVACGQAHGERVAMSDLKFSAAAKEGVFDLSRITTRVFGAQGSGSIRADFSGAVALYRVRCALPQFPVEEFFKTMGMQKVATGRMDFSADLSMQGKTESEMRRSAKGQVSLRGKNLTLHGSDLDREFSRFESSQTFNLVDVGAFFFAGPLGLVVTKGYNFASIYQGGGVSSEIRTLVSEWKVERGVAHAQDVAIATTQNRVALQGGLDFVNDQFDDVTVALIDAKGCAKVRQRIRGSFEKPVVEKPSVLKSLAGPALRLLKKGADILRGGECGVFYAGSVAAPK